MVRILLRLMLTLGFMSVTLVTAARAGGHLRSRDWLAFTALSENGSQVYIVDLPARVVLNIPPAKLCSELDPAWSQDGRLVFLQSCNDLYYDIVILDPLAAQTTNFLNDRFNVAAPVWSADGRIAFGSQQTGVFQLYIGDPLTGSASHVPNSANVYGAPVWSPDGRLAFTAWPDANYRVYVRDSNGTVNYVKWSNSNLPAWSDDGRLAYVQWNPTAFANAVFVDERKIAEVNIFNDAISWSPDGKITLVLNADGQNRDIALLDPDTGVVSSLVQHPADERSPRWSPDGRRLAFLSNRDGVFGVYVLDVATGVVERVSAGLTVVDAPAWAGGEVESRK